MGRRPTAAPADPESSPVAQRAVTVSLPATTTALATMRVLAIDAQATGASPRHGSLLELAWGFGPDSSTNSFSSHVVRLPDGQHIPRQVSKLTGIGPNDLVGAEPPGAIWRRLLEDAAEQPGATATSIAQPIPTVIHFARFEEAFLRDLHIAEEGAAPFAFDMVCLHQVARRLLPTLPRQGLRALAGYFGFPSSMLRRSKAHVEATLFAWRHLVALLANAGVTSWPELSSWLAQTPPARPRAERTFPMLRERRLAVPDQPGVYRFLRAQSSLLACDPTSQPATSERVLYVGKATSLKRRLNSYFQKRRGHNERLMEMLTQARDFEVQVTESIVEAALLESDEIKKYRPPYNVALLEETRGVWFVDPQLQDPVEQPDARHLVGPLPSRGSLSSFAALQSLFVTAEIPGPTQPVAVRESFANLVARAIGIPGGVMGPRLDVEAVLEGAARFRAAVGAPSLDAQPQQARVRLLSWARHRWSARLQQGESPIVPRPPSAEEGVTWPPEQVCLELERSLMNVLQLLRRARWMRRLSNCDVRFSERGGAVRELAFRRAGLLSDALTTSQAGTSGSVDKENAHPRFGVADYDRLRTLITELKRVASEPDGWVEVSLCRGSATMPRRLTRSQTATVLNHL